MTINIVLADDHLIVREGIKTVLRPFKDIRIRGEIADFEALTNHDFAACDVLLLDLSFHGRNALPIIAQIHSAFPDLQILILSVFAEEQYAIKAVQSGAAGYLTKEAAAENLVAAIRSVARGERYISKNVERHLAGASAEDERARIQRLLSDREFEVFLLMGQATPTGAIAEKLALNAKTVSTYKKRILAKLNLTSRGELVRYAIRCGFISVDSPTERL